MGRLPALGSDLLCVVAFVVVGRGSHAGDGSGGSLLTVLAPFLIGLAAAWVAVVVTGARPEGWRAGATVWLLTLGLGMTLRALAFLGGIAFSFVVVAGTFLAVTMLGWRLVVHYVRVRRRRERLPAS